MKASLKSYVTGFILSVMLTLAAAWLVFAHVTSGIFSGDVLIGAILVLAVAQLFVQLIFFMHIAEETGPRFRLVVLFSTVGIIFIVIAGSIWIMNHLNYNMMASPAEMNAYIQSQDGF
ncbi:MAG TPA: cytochrome o ubiquinol oxidase subunit IV [Candidatus Paceibacterota bacterium]|nr:cytochrome o ubiquinol oxidase subunit IV [Candidatus Paceibacterota bacterium]